MRLPVTVALVIVSIVGVSSAHPQRHGGRDSAVDGILTNSIITFIQLQRKAFGVLSTIYDTITNLKDKFGERFPLLKALIDVVQKFKTSLVSALTGTNSIETNEIRPPPGYSQVPGTGGNPPAAQGFYPPSMNVPMPYQGSIPEENVDDSIKSILQRLDSLKAPEQYNGNMVYYHGRLY